MLNVLRGQNRLVLGGSLHWIFHDYRIYIVDDIIDVFSQRYVDPEYTILTENEMILNVKYPYFKKPSYLLIDTLNTDNEEDDEE